MNMEKPRMANNSRVDQLYLYIDQFTWHHFIAIQNSSEKFIVRMMLENSSQNVLLLDYLVSASTFDFHLNGQFISNFL